MKKLILVIVLTIATFIPTAAHASAPDVLERWSRTCTGQAGQPPDIVSGNGLFKLSVCLLIGDRFNQPPINQKWVHALIQLHTYKKINGSWVTDVSDSVTVNRLKWYEITNGGSTIGLPRFGQDFASTDCNVNSDDGATTCSVPNTDRVEFWSDYTTQVPGPGWAYYDGGDNIQFTRVSWRDSFHTAHVYDLEWFFSPTIFPWGM